MKLFLIFFFALTPYAHSSGENIGIFVGNGGEGVLRANHVILRDLYDAGITHPYFGPETNPDLDDTTQLALRFEVMSEVSPELLARKLADLENTSDFLGRYIAYALRSHQWRFTNEDLGSSDNTAGSNHPSGSPIKTVANRFWNTIQVSRPLWDKMDPENRVALVIHEAVYSLLKRSCTSDGLCRQSAEIARALVASAFSPPGTLAPALNELIHHLDIPHYSQSCASLKPEAWVTVGEISHGNFIVMKPARNIIGAGYEQMKKNISLACQHFPVQPLPNYISTSNPIYVRLNARRENFWVQSVRYETKSNVSQLALTVHPRNAILQNDISFATQADCEFGITEFFKNAFTPTQNIDSSALQCKLEKTP